MFDEIIEQLIKKLQDENERKIFEEKVADGTLNLADEVNGLLERKNQVLFCNSKTRNEILRDIGDIPKCRFVVSNVIEDDKVYMVIDKKTRESILHYIEDYKYD